MHPTDCLANPASFAPGRSATIAALSVATSRSHRRRRVEEPASGVEIHNRAPFLAAPSLGAGFVPSICWKSSPRGGTAQPICVDLQHFFYVVAGRRGR